MFTSKEKICPLQLARKQNYHAGLKNTRLLAATKWIREDTKRTLKTANFSYDEHFKFLHHKFSQVIYKVSTDDAWYYTCVVNFDDFWSQNASYKLQVAGKWFLYRSLVFYSARLSVFWFYLVLQPYFFCSSRLLVRVPSLLNAIRFSYFVPSLSACCLSLNTSSLDVFDVFTNRSFLLLHLLYSLLDFFITYNCELQLYLSSFFLSSTLLYSAQDDCFSRLDFVLFRFSYISSFPFGI